MLSEKRSHWRGARLGLVGRPSKPDTSPTLTQTRLGPNRASPSVLSRKYQVRSTPRRELIITDRERSCVRALGSGRANTRHLAGRLCLSDERGGEKAATDDRHEGASLDHAMSYRMNHFARRMWSCSASNRAIRRRWNSRHAWGAHGRMRENRRATLTPGPGPASNLLGAAPRGRAGEKGDLVGKVHNGDASPTSQRLLETPRGPNASSRRSLRSRAVNPSGPLDLRTHMRLAAWLR